MTSFNARLRLRRDNDYNYQRIEDTFIPASGEVCLVDTSRNGLRAKIGDGITLWKDLHFNDEDISMNIIIRGYFSNDEFYSDADLSTPVEASVNKIYIDIATNVIYAFNGMQYVAITQTVTAATAQTAGVMKLYQTTGSNVDGTMSQKAITDELNEKFELRLDLASETLNFVRDLDE